MLLKAVAKWEIKLVKLLVDGGVDVNCRGYDGKTPLLVACSFVPENKNSDSLFVLVEILIRGGANPNGQDPIGRTPLMYAVRHSISTGIINMLLDSGADPNIHDNHGRNIVSYTKRKYWATYKCIFKDHMRTKSGFYYYDIEQFNNCPMGSCSHTDFKELERSLTKTNKTVKELQFDVGDDILLRMTEPNESFAEYRPIPEENENEKPALGSCKENYFRGCDANQHCKDDHIIPTSKRQYKKNIGSDIHTNSIASKRHSSEEMVDKSVTLAYEKLTCKDILKSSSQRRGNTLSGVSEIDKVIVQRGIQNVPAKLPPIS
ncbi:unnamed protein product [Mytilus edulis]|uniref:Uncharacterized protein n=1 Tax=Mytilus edulis TaxID=6550 RepID=A0A8S3VGB6_MYTED|nr:unnamed protein product [Mytilus edulis]